MARRDLQDLKNIDFVEQFSLDDGMLTLKVEGKKYTVLIPEEYPGGEPCILGDVSEVLLPGDLSSIAYQVLQFHQMGGGKRSDSGLMDEAQTMSREATGFNMGAPAIDPNLSSDLERYKDRYGPTMVEHRALDTSDWVTIKVPIYNLIQGHVASAWGVDRGVPITIRLKFDTKSYIEQRNAPKVEMFQGDTKFALGQQMTRVFQTYLTNHWKEGKFQPPTAARGAASIFRPDVAFTPARATDSEERSEPAPKGSKSKERSPLKAHQQDTYAILLEMAFDDTFAYEAAANCDTVEEALDYTPGQKAKKGKGEGGSGELRNFTSDSEGVKSAFSDPNSTVYDSKKDPGKVILYDTAGGFLCHLADVLYKRLPTCSKYCVICDKPHLFGAGGMVRPAVCTRDVCVFAFHELKVGGDAAETVATDAGVIDLLVTVFRLAAFSGRAQDILDPFPQVPDPKNKNKLAFDPNKKDFNLLQTVLKSFPSVAQVVKAEDLTSLRERLNTTNPLAFPLLEWVINSNRSHIVKMAEAQHLPSMGTKHQFLLITAAPEKEKKFAELKRKHGTKFAFHGSGAENWHAILRNGLKNASGTKLQLNGAAHGSGIYFAPEAQTSIGYCRTGTIPGGSTVTKADLGPAFISETSMICLALCEIVSNAITDHGWCWTVANEDACMTRFFFVYDQAQATCGASTKNAMFIDKEVKKSMSYHGLTE